MKTQIIHVVRYLGNDGNQYVRNRACYLTIEGEDLESALMFNRISEACEFALMADRVIGEHMFKAVSLEVYRHPQYDTLNRI